MALGQFYNISTSGNNGVECRVYVSITDDAANNRSSVDAELQMRKSNGFASQGNMSGSFTINGTGITISGNKTLPSSGAWVSLGTAGARWYSHGSNGALVGTVTVAVNSVAMSGSSDYDTPVSGSLGFSNGNGFTNYVRVPGPPGTPVVSNITPTGAKVTWSAPATNNWGTTNYEWVVAPGSASGSGNVLTKDLTGLTPNTAYTVKVRATNSDGTGAYSAVTSFTTLPATPPTLVSVTPDATGKSATLAMTPPSGVGSVSSYNILRRILPGGTFAVVASGSANPSQTITGLTPGATYEWKVQAVIGTYTSPDSNVISVTQPQPNTSPGAYFDGDTADVAGQTNYQWGTAGAGTAGASVSTAQNLSGAVVGWLTGAQAVVVSGGQAVQYQVPGGLVQEGGAFAAQYVVTVPTTVNGFRAGTNGALGYATVTQGGQYMGSIYVEANKARDLAAMWVWYNAAGVEIGTSLGAVQSVVKDGTARLSVLGTAPALAVKGAVVAVDPPGSLKMDAGDTLVVDADMASVGVLYSYFDGATPDTTIYDYGWDDVATPVSNSPSHRLDIPQADQDPLRDPNCDPIPSPPTPPIMQDDCIATETLWRRTWFEVDATSVPAHLAAVPTVNLSTFGYEETQVRIRWYLNPENSDPMAFDSSNWVYEQIISYIPPCSTVTIDGVSHRVWAVVGARSGAGTAGDPYICVPGDYPTISADRLLYGTGGVPADWPVLSCGEGWLVSLDTPLGENASPAGNLVPDMSLTIRE